MLQCGLNSAGIRNMIEGVNYSWTSHIGLSELRLFILADAALRYRVNYRNWKVSRARKEAPLQWPENHPPLDSKYHHTRSIRFQVRVVGEGLSSATPSD